MVLADEEGLGETVGARLLGVGEVDAEPGAVAEQPDEASASWGVVITRMSRIPASISVEIG